MRAVDATKHRWKPWQNINNLSNILQTVDIWVKCYPEFQIGSFRVTKHYKGHGGCKFSGKKRYVTLEWPLKCFATLV